VSEPRLPADVKRLGWVSFFTDISSEMLYAITPIFLTTVLGASAGIVGVIEGVAEATANVMKGLSGWYSDRIRNRKRFIFAGYLLSALAKPLIAMAGSWFFVLVARFLDRFGKGIRGSARDALIADVTPKEMRGRAFGLHRAMDTAGALIGVVISFVILQTLGDTGKQQILLRNLYWIAFFPCDPGRRVHLLRQRIPRRNFRKVHSSRKKIRQALLADRLHCRSCLLGIFERRFSDLEGQRHRTQLAAGPSGVRRV
jgi:MFS family permease